MTEKTLTEMIKELPKFDQEILEKIEEQEKTIGDMRSKLLKFKIHYLESKGYEVKLINNITDTFIFRKGDKLFIDEDDAIDFELFGE